MEQKLAVDTQTKLKDILSVLIVSGASRDVVDPLKVCLRNLEYELEQRFYCVFRFLNNMHELVGYYTDPVNAMNHMTQLVKDGVVGARIEHLTENEKDVLQMSASVHTDVK